MSGSPGCLCTDKGSGSVIVGGVHAAGSLMSRGGGAMEHTGERLMTGSVGEAPSQCPVV